MKIVLFVFVLAILLIAGYLFFSSDYANTEYYHPTQRILLKQDESIAIYEDAVSCYKRNNNMSYYSLERNTVEIISFQRDLRDGQACFKVKINNRNYGYIQSTGVPEVDLIKSGLNTALFSHSHHTPSK